MSIKVLPEAISSKIAAGEVIERPASVVKELVENAIDANATEIRIRVIEAGKSFIEVSDDGIGILDEELPLAVTRFATSKISEIQDLNNIQTLGFRGEALASIAAVSRMTIFSKHKSKEMGHSLQIIGGDLRDSSYQSMPNGTRVIIEDLFFNVPARLKFLKTNATEWKHIFKLISRYALAYPDIRFLLESENSIAMQTSGNGNRREILSQIYGLEVAKQLLEVVYVDDEIKLSGFSSPVGLSRSNRKEITFFINGRWIQNAAIVSALINAYHSFLMVGRFPIAAIFMQISPGEVDVNVHPTKAEIRFRDSGKIFSAVARAVRKTLLSSGTATPISSRTWQNSDSSFQNNYLEWDLAHSLPVYGQKNYPNQDKAGGYDFSQAEIHHSSKVPLLRLIGQIGATYIIAEGPDGLYLIDQHAAHERVLFEKFQKRLESQVINQALLDPVVIDIPRSQLSDYKVIVDILNHMGFDIEEFGKNSIQVRAIPQDFLHINPKDLILAVIEGGEDEGISILHDELEQLLISRICKTAAIKGGQILSTAEQNKLLRDLEMCENPRTCPHGRPTMIHLSVELLEKQFGRRMAR